MAFVLGGEAWSSAGSEQGKKGLVLRELLLGFILAQTNWGTLKVPVGL